MSGLLGNSGFFGHSRYLVKLAMLYILAVSAALTTLATLFIFETPAILATLAVLAVRAT